VTGSWGRTLIAASVGVLVLTACSGGDDEPETEVGGVALERDDDGGSVAVEDERGERAEDEGLVEPDDPDDGTSDDGSSDDDGAADGTDGDAADDASDDGTSTSGSSTSGGTTSTGSGSGGSAPAPSPSPSPTAAPAPSPSPTTAPAPSPSPSPTPSPRVLWSGPAVTGSEAIGLGDDGWVVTSSTGPTEPGELPPPFRVDVDVVSDDAGPVGGAVCAVSLQAGDDRGLVAVGRATVTLVLTADDGTVRRLTRQLLDLDVELGPGGSLQVDPSAPVQVDARELERATCEARFDPAA
jgi:hypothetical protein